MDHSVGVSVGISLIEMVFLFMILYIKSTMIGKGGKNRRRGKGDGEESKRELEFKEDGTLCHVICFDFWFWFWIVK